MGYKTLFKSKITIYLATLLVMILTTCFSSILVLAYDDEQTTSLIDNLESNVITKLLKNTDIKAYYGLNAVKCSVRSADYAGGRYIVVEYDLNIGLYDLETKSISQIIDTESRCPKIAGNYVVYEKYELEGSRIKKSNTILYNIMTKEKIDITPHSYRTGGQIFSEDGKYVTFTTARLDNYDIAHRFVYSIEDKKLINIDDSGQYLGSMDWESCWAGNTLIYLGRSNTSEDIRNYTPVFKKYDAISGEVTDFDLEEGYDTDRIRGYGNWIVYETGDGVYIKNLITDEERHIFVEPKPTSRTPGVFTPIINENYVIWHNRGNFYLYDIETKNTHKLSDDNVAPNRWGDSRQHQR